MAGLQRTFKASCLLSVSVVFLLWLSITARPSMAATQIVPIGVILDLDSRLGEMIYNSLAFAIDEYYFDKSQTATKIGLIVQNVRWNADIVAAAAAAYNLTRIKKVHAILGPRNSEQARVVVKIGEKYQVPVIWFPMTGPSLLLPPSPSSIYSDEGLNCFQFRAIADIIKAVGWQSIVPIYEETEYGSHLLPCLSNVLKEMGVQMANVTAIASKLEGINSTLDKLKDMRTHVFLVHMSMQFGTELILAAGRKEMMGEGYAWILTQELSSLTEPLVKFSRELHRPQQGEPESFTDYRSVRMDMQGALGVRPVDLNKTAEKRKKIESNFLKKFNSDLPIYGWWAYHTIEALATAVEMQRTENNGTKLGEEIRATNFTGVSGVHFNLRKGQLDQSVLEVYNVIGPRERIIGSWSPETGLVQNHDKDDIETSSEYQLKDPLWPGDTLDKPPKLRIGVPRTNSFPEFVNVYNSGKLHFDGFAINVFSKAVKVLPFSLKNYEFVPLPTQSRSHNTSYDDILCRQMKEEDLDAIIGDITIVPIRTTCVDFTFPYLDSSVAMVVRVKKKTSTSKGILLKPFKWSLWLILGAIFVGATIIINALEIIRAKEVRFNNPFLVYKIDVMKDFESTTARWMVILASFLFILVVQVYTAKLTSILTQGTINEPSFKDENEIKSGNVPVGYQNGSWVRGLLIDEIGLKDEQLKGLRSREEYNEALSDGTVDAIFDETPYLILFLSRYKSRFMMTGSMYQTGGFSFAFPKKSGFTSHFSTAILNVTQEVEPYRVLMSQSSLPTSIEDLEFEDQNDIETSSISISNIGGFYPVLASIVVAFLFGLVILNPSVIKQRLCPKFSAQALRRLNPANPSNGQGHI